MAWISILLAVAVFAVIVGGITHRCLTKKEIAWPFIRYTVIATGMLMCGILAMNSLLSEGALAILAGSIAFAFAKPTEKE